MKQTTWIKVNHYYNLPMWPFEHTEERAFVTFRGLWLYRGKNLLNAPAKWLVYTTIRRIYTPNGKCRTRKKHESILDCKLPKIPKITKKCPDCDILGLWLKDAFRNDQYLHFIHTLLSNWYDIIFSFCSRTYLFASIKLWSPKSNESRRKYTFQLSRIMHESNACGLTTVISHIKDNFSRLTQKSRQIDF